MFKVYIKNTRTTSTMSGDSGVFIVNFKLSSHFFSGVSIVEFEQVNDTY